MRSCAPLPLLTRDLEALWREIPAEVPRTILDNEAAQGLAYRECARRHGALIEWVRSLQQ